ncbi:glycogen debranching N-terminal domain-containing protein [Streptomyces arenae]|uniref:glycogen debranching N-terminal domain-containing protein n=1 Tax=Streptomyces arenae TaxID=29301 RepID=UPI00265A27C4|nr:glycogen debranching N-terminal domain-containing protein [Streptomyces arenae]MCG7210640.1 glycogen debranching protein [Streptomyces arenae]
MQEPLDPSARAHLQPLLHDVVLCVTAPAFTASPRDGQLTGARVDGFYDHDRRLLHTLRLLVDGREPEPIGVQPLGPDRVKFTAVHRYTQDGTDDPSVLVERTRAARGTESLTVRNTGTRTRRLNVALTAATDLVTVADVKRGHRGPAVPCTAGPRSLSWTSDGEHARLEAVSGSAPEVSAGPAQGTLVWRSVVLPANSCWTVRLTVSGGTDTAPAGHPVAPRTPAPWAEPTVHGDARLVALVRRGLEDLDALRLADPLRTGADDGEDQFVAAGCPWFLTLFGRDSIWAARMMLPLGTGLARGTLWALARRQGTEHHDFREEAPGRILHELRPADAQHGHGLSLPSRYYGSVDATPLFVTLLVDAWHWGMPDADVDALLPAAERAMEWVRQSCAQDEDQLLRYHSRSGGLRHQSWKDSADAVRDAEGRHVGPPLAVCEVQGYAYEAAVGLAGLLHHRGRDDRAAELRDWAASLRKRFDELFWVPAASGPAARYPAVAVGEDGQAVTGPASNMGHLLSTGIIDATGSKDVAAWLAAPGLSSGWGLRSRSADVPGFNPFSYHGGAVWTHDTAIAVSGLCSAGHRREALVLAEGLLDASTHFDHRMPELYGGEAREPSSPPPLPYPATCRPQGWSAASGMALLTALLGLRPDAARRVLTVAPAHPAPLLVEGLALAGNTLHVEVTAAGEGKCSGLPAGWRVENG